MTEMRRTVIGGLIENRSEYHATDATLHTLRTEALEHIEDLLETERGNEQTYLAYSYDDGVAIRELLVGVVDDGIDEAEEILYARGDEILSFQLGRLPITTEILVRTDHYKEGALQEAAKISIRQYILGSEHPMIADYTFESYVGGGLQAVVARTDALKEQGLDERDMTAYDFEEFRQQLAVIAAMRTGMRVGDGRAGSARA